jgi:hypothetical protein
MVIWHFPEARRLEWWPSHVRQAFTNLGRVLGPEQLNPSILPLVSRDGLPEHQILFGHIAGNELGKRKGLYVLEIAGPLYAGRWSFPSGLLEELARATAEAA